MFSKFATNNGGDGTEILMIYGKQDRHVDGDGRLRTYKLMTDAGVHFEWLEVRLASVALFSKLLRWKYRYERRMAHSHYYSKAFWHTTISILE
jgi:hypothetical protein